ncbi:hypothetical protein J6590_093610 [Homalodisca vitripennis]|nr:hypothetical protein J6590_093610 [Homalodisca vitripennis]
MPVVTRRNLHDSWEYKYSKHLAGVPQRVRTFRVRRGGRRDVTDPDSGTLTDWAVNQLGELTRCSTSTNMSGAPLVQTSDRNHPALLLTMPSSLPRFRPEKPTRGAHAEQSEGTNFLNLQLKYKIPHLGQSDIERCKTSEEPFLIKKLKC